MVLDCFKVIDEVKLMSIPHEEVYSSLGLTKVVKASNFK